MLRDGVPVEYRRDDGSIAGDHVRLIDFDNPDANDWLAVNQFTVIEGQNNRRPDIVVFVNGLPLGIIELKIPEDTDKWFAAAYNQIQTYKQEIPSLMHYNEVTVISDGLEARIGSLTANQEWFKVWRTIEGEFDAPATALELETLVRGVFEKRRFLDLIRNFIAFEDDPDRGTTNKIIAGYHQFLAVKAAVDETLRATAKDRVAEAPGTYWAGKMEGGKEGDRRVGVVWHTQGSGKSLSMLFYAGCIIEHPAMENPTLVFLTDRNDLDDQLFGQFQRCHEIVRQTPVQAESVKHLRELLNVASGGVVFTTMQKFAPDEPTGKAPLLSNRRNILVIADEAHRSQYDLIDGLARNVRDSLPNASFIGFTGTPIEKTDANTRAVFGDYISIYDIQRAVADKATVPIYYESRVAKLGLNASELPKIDKEFEEITEGEELTRKEKLKTKWAALEALVGDPKRIDLIAADLVKHYERRLEAMDGKAMIVCMSRRICVDLYNAIIKLRPEWASGPNDDDTAKSCVAKIVMTGSAEDGPDWQQHIRNKEKRRKLAGRFKDPKDPFRIVIVRDMWLTGFDAPSLSTMYADKPMRGHGLMQAIARVNRVFRDKPGGLVVDYLGLADQLKQALAAYTQSGGKGDPSIDTAKAIAVMLEKHEIACGMMHGFDWSKWQRGTPAEKMALLPGAQEHILEQENGKERFVQVVTELSQAFALCAGTDEAIAIRDDIGFFQAVKAALAKKRGERKINRGTRPRRPAVSRKGDRARRRDHRRLPSRRTEAAGHQHPVRSIPRRSSRTEIQERRRRAAREAVRRRNQSALEAEPRSKPRVLREAEEDAQRLSQPRHRDAGSHRRTDQARQGNERRESARRRSRPERRRSRLLRRARRQRQRRRSDGQRQAESDRDRTCHPGAQKRHHRLDAPRKRPRQDQSLGETNSSKTRLPTRPAGRSDKARLAQAELLCAEWAA